MRFLTVNSSYRKRGNTARAVELVIAELERLARADSTPLQIDSVNLAHLDLQICRGCRVCFDQGETKCPLRDDLLDIRTRMEAADAILVASPVYVNDVNGVMKNWLDRMAHACHRPAFAGRSAFLLATSGEAAARHALKTLDFGLRSWGYFIVGKAGWATGAYMPSPELRAQYRPNAAQIAQKIFSAVQGRRHSRPSFLSLMIFRIQQRYWQRNRESCYDRAYWSAQGWIRPDREFYIPHETGVVKASLARLAGSILARIVT